MPEGATGGATGGAVLLKTKLHAPRLRPELFARDKLMEQLATDPPRLTLVDAGAGWGKSTLLAQWRASDASRFAWLSLEPADSDPVRFWTYVVVALQTVRTSLGERALRLLRTPGTNIVENVVPELLNDLAARREPVVLVLDDYHVVTSQDIHTQIAFFVERLPPALRLVIASRSHPPLPLGRLRARGDLAEVRADDLRFSDRESALFLNDVLGFQLTEQDVGSLQERTEGWAAGLYLAALSLRGRRDPEAFIVAFAGDDRHLVDYLGAEVLGGLTPDARTFLLRSSVLGRLCGELCDAVTGLGSSRERLERIEQSNLFLVPLDSTRTWFRFHHLFRELLRHELERTEADLVPELHRRACAWHRERGDVEDAVHHATAAGEVDLASDLVASHWNAFANEGKLVTVTSWLDSLPAGVVARDPRLCLARAWHALLTNRIDEIEGWIVKAEAGSLPGPLRDGTNSKTRLRRGIRWRTAPSPPCISGEARRPRRLPRSTKPCVSRKRGGTSCLRSGRSNSVPSSQPSPGNPRQRSAWSTRRWRSRPSTDSKSIGCTAPASSRSLMPVRCAESTPRRSPRRSVRSSSCGADRGRWSWGWR